VVPIAPTMPQQQQIASIVQVPTAKLSKFNQSSVATLQALGFPDDEIFEVLDYLTSQKHYTSYGEVDKALEHIQRKRQLQEEAYQQQINSLQLKSEVVDQTTKV